MKIKSIKFKEHSVLDNIEFDFTINGIAADTIIIAGENGCGKTQLLESIYSLSTLWPGQPKHNGIAEYVVEFSEEEFENIKTIEERSFQNMPIEKRTWNYTKIMKLIRTSSNDPMTKLTILFQIEEPISKEIDYFRVSNPYNYSNSPVLKDIFKSIYSKTEVNYVAKTLSTVTAKKLDTPINNSVSSSLDLATEIKQLIIDVESNDNAELSKWVKNHSGEIPPDEIKEIGIKRFNNAFKVLFDNLQIDKIENTNNVKGVVFKKGKKEIDLSDLSSGEKQIIFRGAFLLKDQMSIKGCKVLIDEPELSLHPNWQKNILDFYKQLFTENGIQTSQMFIVTHSPYVVHGISANDKVIILSSKDGTIKIDYESKFPSIGPEIPIQHAFGISDPITKPTVFVEGRTDEKYLKKYLEIHSSKYEFNIEWIGKFVDGNEIYTGSNSLNNCLAFAKSKSKFFKAPTLLLYDCDTKKPDDNFDNIFVRCIPKKEGAICTKGIENLLDLDKDTIKRYTEYKEEDNGSGENKIIPTLKKAKLCDFICDNVDQNYRIESLSEVIKIVEDCLQK